MHVRSKTVKKGGIVYMTLSEFGSICSIADFFLTLLIICVRQRKKVSYLLQQIAHSLSWPRSPQ